EFESQFSSSATVTCWADLELGELGVPALTFDGQPVPDPQGTMFLQTRIRAATGTPFGVLMVAEELHRDSSNNWAAAAVNLDVEGQRSNADIITIPAEQLCTGDDCH